MLRNTNYNIDQFGASSGKEMEREWEREYSTQKRAQELLDDNDKDNDDDNDDSDDNDEYVVVICQQAKLKGKQLESRQQSTREQSARHPQLINEVTELRKECSSLRMAVKEMKDDFKCSFTILKGQTITIEQLGRDKKTLQAQVGSLEDQVAYLTSKNVAMRKDFEAVKSHLSKDDILSLVLFDVFDTPKPCRSSPCP